MKDLSKPQLSSSDAWIEASVNPIKVKELINGSLIDRDIRGIVNLLITDFINNQSCAVWIEDDMASMRSVAGLFYKECSAREIDMNQLKFSYSRTFNEEQGCLLWHISAKKGTPSSTGGGATGSPPSSGDTDFFGWSPWD